MNVEIVAITAPAGRHIPPTVVTPEDLIVYIARVSNPENQDNVGTGAKLLRYCLDHGHVSVFESVSMTVEIETTRMISAQLLRHRSFTFQEFSQRYAKTPGEVEVPEARTQDAKNRQSSLPCEDAEVSEWWEDNSASVMYLSRYVYNQALEKGIAKEVARAVLPMATQTRLYMTGNVRSWIHYLGSRLDPTTQLEHRVVAHEIAQIFLEQFPVVSEAIDLRTKMFDSKVG